MSNVRVVDRYTSEWSSLWAALAGNELNYDNKQPTACLNEGEQWAYTGTMIGEDSDVHFFHHANHPKCGEVTLKFTTSH